MLDKAVIHCDVDCFYCQVEVKDNPGLANRPLAVHQGNSGGFVAVNYKVSAQVLTLISQHAMNDNCEKTSYDDFYLEVLPDSASLAKAETWLPPADQAVHVLGGGSFSTLPAVLKQAVQAASNIKAAVQKELSLTMSFGIAAGKLAARLAGPIHKPSGMTVVPPSRAAAFLLETPILKVPHLRGNVGRKVVEQLSVEHVHDLAAYQAKELIDMFGAATGQLLFDLGHCIDDKRVQAKGPQHSICCTKSYHGLRDHAQVDEALQRLVFALWPRLLEERSNSGRIPAKLKLSCKQGGREQQTRSYTLPFPYAAVSQLRATTLGSVDSAVTQSSAVHTLIPNLAPRSRLQQQRLGTRSESSSEASGAVGGSGQVQMPGAEEFSKEPGSICKHAGELLQSGCHQAARQAIFQAAMSLLEAKLAEPVLVSFMAVAGEYVKDIKQTAGSKQGVMLRFVHKASAVPSCPTSRCKTAASPQGTQSHPNSQTPVLTQDWSAGLVRSSTVHNKRSARALTMQQQPDGAKSDQFMSNQFKLPRKGMGPMDKFLQ